jgi:hypothetical protein
MSHHSKPSSYCHKSIKKTSMNECEITLYDGTRIRLWTHKNQRGRKTLQIVVAGKFDNIGLERVRK